MRTKKTIPEITRNELLPLHQTVYQTVIPVVPKGLIGEKVVFNESFCARKKYRPDIPLPECGYFTIVDVSFNININDKTMVLVKISEAPKYWNEFAKYFSASFSRCTNLPTSWQITHKWKKPDTSAWTAYRL